jgi:hypothetical protein
MWHCVKIMLITAEVFMVMNTSIDKELIELSVRDSFCFAIVLDDSLGDFETQKYSVLTCASVAVRGSVDDIHMVAYRVE